MAVSTGLFDSRVHMLFLALCRLERTERDRADGFGVTATEGKSHSFIHSAFMVFTSLSGGDAGLPEVS